jgi:putative addiction module component (TIGR02574 family)
MGGVTMSVSIESFGIQQLSVGDRLELIEQIWDSLPEQVSLAEVPEWHLAELAKRRVGADARENVGKPWREALDAIEGGP